jgi:hypothetical protein
MILPRAGEVQLEDTLRRAFERPATGVPLSAGEFMALSSAALGVLLREPRDELEAMRPALASWLRRNRERFRAEGLPDDKDGAKSPRGVPGHNRSEPLCGSLEEPDGAGGLRRL